MGDPRLLALPGLERMQTGLNKQILPPPIHHLFGLAPTGLAPDQITFSMPCSPWLQSDAGVYFAGTAALVADAALGGAVMAPLGPGDVVVTSDLSMNFLRPVGVGSGELVCRAKPIEVGRTLGLAEGVVEDGQGRLVAHCTTRCFVVHLDVPEMTESIELPEIELPVYDTPDPYLRELPDEATRPDLYETQQFLEIVKGLQEGRPPAPFVHLFAGQGIDAEPGAFRGRFAATPWMASYAGSVYGGVLAFMADTFLTGAFSTTLDTHEIAATLDLKVQFVRPVWPDGGLLSGEARVVHRGKRFVAAQGEIKNARGKTVVLMTSSAAIRTGRSWGAMVVADDAMAPAEGG